MIYVVKHKPYDTPMMEGYKDLWVGKACTSDNPLNKFNPYINEATALYDIIKSGDEIVGLVHYRRIFKDLPFEKAVDLLDKYDVITTTLHPCASPYLHLASALGADIVYKYVNQLPNEVQE